MDREERAYLETAIAYLRDAEIAFENDRYHLTALLSAMSAENATSSLIVHLGSRPSRKHRNSLVLHRLSEEAPKPLKSKLMMLIESMKRLEPHITKARYPTRRGVELIPPVRLYSAESAKELLEEAHRVLKSVRELMGVSGEADQA